MADFLPIESMPYWTARLGSTEESKASKDAGADTVGNEPAAAEHHHQYRRHLNEALARFAHAFSLSYYGEPRSRDIEPRVDVMENKEAFAAIVELPGLRPEDVHVEANDHLFTVSFEGNLHRHGSAGQAGAVSVEHKEGAATADHGAAAKAPRIDVSIEAPHLHIAERSTGHFHRMLQLPVGFVEMGSVTATMADGLLTISVPKKIPGAAAAAKKGRKVEVAPEAEALA